MYGFLFVMCLVVLVGCVQFALYMLGKALFGGVEYEQPVSKAVKASQYRAKRPVHNNRRSRK